MRSYETAGRGAINDDRVRRAGLDRVIYGQRSIPHRCERRFAAAPTIPGVVEQHDLGFNWKGARDFAAALRCAELIAAAIQDGHLTVGAADTGDCDITVLSPYSEPLDLLLAFRSGVLDTLVGLQQFAFRDREGAATDRTQARDEQGKTRCMMSEP